jgi:hypothetical protein
MCFSATASFLAAVTTAAIGIATLKRVNHARELPLAAMPLLFAFQQAVEGFLWLQLTGKSGGGVPALSLIFLIFAKALWPTYTALAVLLIEPDLRRMRTLRAIVLLGCVISTYVLIGLINYPPAVATICGQSIHYGGNEKAFSWQSIAYLICICAPLLLSSRGVIRIFGAMVLIGFVVSAYVYSATFTSVWCFFAAADSTVLYFYFNCAAMRARLQHR